MRVDQYRHDCHKQREASLVFSSPLIQALNNDENGVFGMEDPRWQQHQWAEFIGEVLPSHRISP